MNGYTVSSSPHIRNRASVSRIMLDVVLALVPAGLVSLYFYGPRVLMVCGLGILSAVLTEALIQKWMKKPVTITDFSAVVTGLLLAYNLPPTVPWWMPVVGSAIAVALIKHAFGGLGQNFMNPALAARAILLAAWPVRMTAWIWPGVDAVSTATPLAILKGTEAAGITLPPLWNTFIGDIGGSIGEISSAALLLGAAYLLYRRIIHWRIPVTFIATTALTVILLGGHDLYIGIYHIFAGGLILGAFYMATDYASSPVTPKGQWLMGIGCGLITGIIRLYGGYPEGVTYAVLIMNTAAPLIDKLTMPRIYGEVKSHG